MHCDQYRGCRTERRHCQIAELRQTIDNDDIVIVAHTRERIIKPRKEDRPCLAAALRQNPWRVIFEFGQLDVPRDNIEPGKIGAPDHRR